MTISTDLAVRDDAVPALRLPALPSLPDTDSWIRAMASIAKLADQICHTSFVPKGLRDDPAAVTAAILTGRELGLPPMAALRHIHVVEGTPSLDAEYKRAKVLEKGHEFRILEWDDEHCKVAARRKGDRNPPLVVEYTIRDARKAGLVKDRGNYITRPRVMMLARATTLVTNAIFADVTNGLATTELLESGDTDAVADAIGASLELPAAPRPSAADALRARRPQAVTAEVVETDPTTAASSSSSGSGTASIPVATSPADEPASAEQLREINARLVALGYPGSGQRDREMRQQVAAKIARLDAAGGEVMLASHAETVLAALRPMTEAAEVAALLDDIAIEADGDPRDEEAATDGE